MNEELKKIREFKKGLTSLTDEELLLKGENYQDPVFLAITQERERRSREEQYKLNKKNCLEHYNWYSDWHNNWCSNKYCY